MLKEVEENPSGYNLFNTGNVYYSLQDFETAIQYYQRAYPLSKERTFTSELLTKLATSLSYTERHVDGLNILVDAVELFPQAVDLQFALGKILFEAGYLKDAEIAFRKCIEMGDTGFAVTEGAGGYSARFYLSQLYVQKVNLLRALKRF